MIVSAVHQCESVYTYIHICMCVCVVFISQRNFTDKSGDFLT